MDGIKNNLRQAGVDFINGARNLSQSDTQANKVGQMAGRAVSQLKEGASSILSALKEGMKGVKDNMLNSPGYTQAEFKAMGVPDNVAESLKKSGLG